MDAQYRTKVHQLDTGLRDPAVNTGGPVAWHRRVPVQRDGFQGRAGRRRLDEGAAVAKVAADAARGDDDGVFRAELAADVLCSPADPAVCVAAGAFRLRGRQGSVPRKLHMLVSSHGDDKLYVRTGQELPGSSTLESMEMRQLAAESQPMSTSSPASPPCRRRL